MTQKSPITLVNFFVFNSSFGPREGEEHKKILYYYPADVDIDSKIKNVGLVEAIVKFSETFSDKPCESLHTQKTRQIIFEPEKEFFINMTVSIPYSQKVKDGQAYIEYHEDDIQDSVYEAVLKQAYKMFKLFMGTFYTILEKGNVQSVKQRLEHFYSRYLLTLKLSQSDILDVFCGIHFLPLDKNTYLRIQCFINLLETSFPQIKHSAFLYNDQLVWSGLEQDDMRIMYKYLTTSLFPSYMEQELQGGPPSSPPVSFTSTSHYGNLRDGEQVRLSNSTLQVISFPHYGKFITGPPSLSDPSNLGKVPRVYINTHVEDEECYLLVYRALSATVCLLVDASYQLNLEFFRRVDGFLGPQLSALASDISDQYSKRPLSSSDVQFKYIYFNHMNLAEKTTVHTDSKKSSNLAITQDLLLLLSDINSDISGRVDDSETIVKTCSDCWVVGKKSDQREFYVVINQRNANLIEINEEVKRLCASHFNSIFFLD